MDVGTPCTHVACAPTAGSARRSLGAATRRKTVTRGAGCLSWARPDLAGGALGRSMAIAKTGTPVETPDTAKRKPPTGTSALSRQPIDTGALDRPNVRAAPPLLRSCITHSDLPAFLS